MSMSALSVSSLLLSTLMVSPAVEKTRSLGVELAWTHISLRKIRQEGQSVSFTIPPEGSVCLHTDTYKASVDLDLLVYLL